uniref:Uncharacterized protein n=1 Tax=Oryza nivara TaxID=4536 RepID=A0A0E0H0K9_ORYNI
MVNRDTPLYRSPAAPKDYLHPQPPVVALSYLRSTSFTFGWIDLLESTQDTKVTPDIKNYTDIIGQFLLQTRISKTYIQPLMGGRKTMDIQVEAADRISVTLTLHVSTHGRCNLKKRMGNFCSEQWHTSSVRLHLSLPQGTSTPNDNRCLLNAMPRANGALPL